MREDFKEVYDAFFKKYGEHSQIQQCIEEMSELIKELCKYERYKGQNVEKEAKAIEGIKEELADVLNMAEQLQYIFGIDEVEDIRNEKIELSRKIYLK